MNESSLWRYGVTALDAIFRIICCATFLFFTDPCPGDEWGVVLFWTLFGTACVHLLNGVIEIFYDVDEPDDSPRWNWDLYYLA